MQKISYRLVYNRKKNLNAEGKALVQIECYLRPNKIYISTHIYLKPYQWDNERKLIVNHPNEDELNMCLWEEMINYERQELSMWKRGVEPTLASMKQFATDGDHPTEIGFKEFAIRAINESTRCENTKKAMRYTIRTMSQFRPGYTWNDLTYVFLKELEAWYLRHDIGINTIAKHMQGIRALMNEAIHEGYMHRDNDPFQHYQIKKEKTAHRYLTPDELETIERMRVEKKLEHTRDAFLFCCYTGLRFSDFTTLMSDNLQRIGGETWLVKHTQKTGYNVKIPLTVIFRGKAMVLIKKYGDVEKLAAVGCNSDVNRKLSVIQQHAGIQTRITFHTARHTCATVLVHQGVPISTVQRILGHTKISTTQHYSEIMADTILTDLKKVNNFQDRGKKR